MAQTEGKIVHRCKLFVTFSVSLVFSLFMTRIYITHPPSHVEGCWVQAEEPNSMHSQAEGLSTAGVNQMPSPVSPQGEICPQGLKDWEFFFCHRCQHSPLWGKLFMLFLDFWWFETIPALYGPALCNRCTWERSLTDIAKKSMKSPCSQSVNLTCFSWHEEGWKKVFLLFITHQLFVQTDTSSFASCADSSSR